MNTRNPFVSILIPYYDRPIQLERSLYLLERQTYPDCEIIIVDDGSGTPPARFYVGSASLHVGKYHPQWYYRIRSARSSPRSPNTAWNFAYAKAKGDFIIVTHPEILVPFDGIATLLEHTPEDRRGVPIQLCLDWSHRIDSVDWRTDLKLLETLPDFWSTTSPWLYDNLSAKDYRHHFSFSGAYRSYWDRFGFIPEVEDPNFQSDDAWMHAQELAAGTPPLPVPLTVYHQHHERVYGNIPQYSKRILQIRKSISD